MNTALRPPPHHRASAWREWPVWELPGWLLAFIAAVTAADLIAIGVCAAATQFRGADLELCAVLLACNLATVELTHRASEPAGLVKDVHAVWELPLALLLPPFYALLVPIPRMALVQWRVRPTLIHRRVFTAAAVGLSYGAASLTFHATAPLITGLAPGPQTRVLAWTGAAAACAVLKSAVNKVLVMTAVKGADPAASVRAELFTREPLFNDAAELSVGIMVAHAVTASPFMSLIALPLVALLHRSFRHAQLVDASRIDGKTGLLNAATWQREARLETMRAVQTRTPLAVAIADIDHFKNVNDTFGHLAGDTVLAGIASALNGLLRDCDITGRFGGEEFTILLPRTDAAEALQITERLRQKISQISTPVSDETSRDAPLRVTVSIGVAALEASRRDLDELLAAADHALYEAKKAGRNRVRMVSENSARLAAPWSTEDVDRLHSGSRSRAVGDRLDLDQHPRIDQGRYPDHGRGGHDIAERGAVRAPVLLPARHVGDEHAGPHYVRERGAELIEGGAHIADRLRCLRVGVAFVHEVRAEHRRAAGHEHVVTRGHRAAVPHDRLPRGPGRDPPRHPATPRRVTRPPAARHVTRPPPAALAPG
jgi:diguanylate cyclase (GGDEF)-like protein